MQYNAEQHAAYQAMEQSQQPQGGNTKALNLEWVVGFNKDIDMGVHYLADEERTVSHLFASEFSLPFFRKFSTLLHTLVSFTTMKQRRKSYCRVTATESRQSLSRTTNAGLLLPTQAKILSSLCGTLEPARLWELTPILTQVVLPTWISHVITSSLWPLVLISTRACTCGTGQMKRKKVPFAVANSFALTLWNTSSGSSSTPIETTRW